MTRLITAVVLLMLIGCAEAPPRRHTLRAELAGLEYGAARAKLLAEGWAAVPSAAAPGAGPARTAYDHGWTEVESCTEGEVVCSFGFKRGDDCLHVVTTGNRVERIDRRCF